MQHHDDYNNRANVTGKALGIVYTFGLAGRKILRKIVSAPQVGVQALIVRSDEVVIVRHREGLLPWGLPSGTVKPLETLEQAVQREVLEETGCMVRIERLHGMFYRGHQPSNDCVFVFVCSPLTALRPPRWDVEIATAMYVSCNSLPFYTDGDTRTRIDEYLHGKSGIISLS
jgi:ADP-ribose pyrophosphatase YjhB (NUDIX family)